MTARRDGSEQRHVNVRMREDLRQRVEQSAAAKRISLNADIIDRLERSFAEERGAAEQLRDMFGGPRQFKLMLLLSKAISFVEELRGGSIEDNPLVLAAATQAINGILTTLGPKLTAADVEGGGGLLSGHPDSSSPYEQALADGQKIASGIVELMRRGLPSNGGAS